jgi:Phosphodiester glycosidase
MSGPVPEDARQWWPGGQAPYGGPPYGGPTQAEPSYGGPTQGEPSYGEPAYGGPPYVGQPPFVGQPYGGPPNGGPPKGRQGAHGRRRKPRFRRLRRFARRRTVRVIGALFAVFLIWVAFSVGQAVTANNGLTFSEKLAEWARDHYLGPVVTFGEWLTYSPPKVGGKPSFSLAVPSGEAISAAKVPAKGKHHHKPAFQPYIPATLKSLAGAPQPGEGQWRVVEKVKGEPAILTTFLRDATYTSYVNGIVSMDQRLVKFQLHPGASDPGAGNWGAQPWIPPGDRTGLLATFNGGFRLNSSEGGWYLNGQYDGSLVSGAASVVYYKNGTVKIGEWGRDFHMSKQIEGVRQNLKLLVDRGKALDANAAVQSSWGATLGGGDYVWRSGVGITKNDRIIFVYGPELDAQDLAQLLQRAGAVEGMELDINPAWMNFEYYQVDGHASDPTPVPLLPTQQPDPYRYYSVYSRDFTAVYAR